MAVLVVAEDVAGAAHVEVVLCHSHAGAKLRVLHEHLEPPLGVGRQAARVGNKEVAVGAIAAPPHPSAELVELRQAELVGMVDEHGVGGRDVDARLNDGRGDEHIDPMGDEVHHHLLELIILHLCVADADARLGHHPPDLVGQTVDGIDPVVHEVDLAAPRQLLLNPLTHHRVAEACKMGPNRQSTGWGRGDDRQVADAEQRHLERARDGRGRHRQHVDAGAELLEPLLVLHAKTLLLVDDEQRQIGDLHILRDEPVGADDDVDLALRGSRQNGLHLLWRPEPGKCLDAGARLAEPTAEGIEVLLA